MKKKIKGTVLIYKNQLDVWEAMRELNEKHNCDHFRLECLTVSDMQVYSVKSITVTIENGYPLNKVLDDIYLTNNGVVADYNWDKV